MPYDNQNPYKNGEYASHSATVLRTERDYTQLRARLILAQALALRSRLEYTDATPKDRVVELTAALDAYGRSINDSFTQAAHSGDESFIMDADKFHRLRAALTDSRRDASLLRAMLEEPRSTVEDAIRSGCSDVVWRQIQHETISKHPDVALIDFLIGVIPNDAVRQAIRDTLTRCSSQDIRYALLEERSEVEPQAAHVRHDPTKQVKRGIAALALGVTLAATVSHLGSWSDGGVEASVSASQTAAPVATHDQRSDLERSDSGVCINPETERFLLETDCLFLPSYEGGTDTLQRLSINYDSGDSDTDLTAVLKDGAWQFAPGFSKAYIDALEVASGDSYIHSVNKGLDVPIVVNDTFLPDDENGFYEPDDDVVRLTFLQHSDRQAETFYPTYGSVRSTLIHENAHAVYHYAMDKFKKFSKVDRAMLASGLDDLDAVCSTDIVSASADVTMQVQAPLNQLQDTVNSLKFSPRIRAKLQQKINHYSVALSHPDRLRSMLYINGDNDPETTCEIDPSEVYYDLTSVLSDSEWNSFVETDSEHTVFNAAAALVDPLVIAAQDELSGRQEGDLLKGMNSNDAGHSYEGSSERFATTTALVQVAPDSYVEMVKSISDDSSRRREVRALEAVATITQVVLPDEYAKTNFAYVLEQLRDVE